MRGAPTCDLSVALLAGLQPLCLRSAPSLAALPGVAIAAALVPLYRDDRGVFIHWRSRGGSGSCFAFWNQCGCHRRGGDHCLLLVWARGQAQQRMWVPRTFIALVVTMLVLMIPLSAYLWSLAQQSPTGLTLNVREAVDPFGFRLVHLEHDGEVLELKLQGADKPSPKLLNKLDDVVSRQFGRHVVLRVISEFAVVVDATHLDEDDTAKITD